MTPAVTLVLAFLTLAVVLGVLAGLVLGTAVLGIGSVL